MTGRPEALHWTTVPGTAPASVAGGLAILPEGASVLSPEDVNVVAEIDPSTLTVQLRFEFPPDANEDDLTTFVADVVARLDAAYREVGGSGFRVLSAEVPDPAPSPGDKP